MPDHDLLVEYALGTLDESRHAEVEAYLREHPEAEAEVRAYMDGMARMVLDLDPEPVPAGGLDGLLARVREDRASDGGTPIAPRTSATSPASEPGPAEPKAPANVRWEPSPHPAPRRSLLPWVGFAAVVALALALTLGAPLLRGWQAQRQFDAYRAQPGAVTHRLTAQNGGELGTLVRLTNGRTFVLLRDAPQAGRVYQAWQVADGKPVSLGVFEGRQFLTPPLPAGATFAVSVEPEGGSAQPTTTPITVTQL
ncbi:anti-sigma factor domain-containing protein [Deinococcus pimensis]|uniref:anti-sigma factor n=1 Tax=Deinococcus pimensis TaxID=309888 RepID=UPI0004B4BED0|nr:anti-sigma factor [Deinococcus pimensis]